MDKIRKGNIRKVKAQFDKEQEDCWAAVAEFQARFKSKGWTIPGSVPGQTQATTLSLSTAHLFTSLCYPGDAIINAVCNVTQINSRFRERAEETPIL